MIDALTELGTKYETDKVSGHYYTPEYHRRFEAIREDPVMLLEIGVGGYDDPALGGNSLRMWKDYFPNGTIVGLDIHDKRGLTEDRIHLEQGDQSDPRVLHHLGKTYGPFDIIVDDGSHKVDDIVQSWVILWSYLRNGGWYAIEDLQTAYWPAYGGSSVTTGDSTIGFLQGMVDRIHFAEADLPGYAPTRFDVSVTAVEVSRNLAFLRKGDNTAPSNIMPAHPHPVFWKDEANDDGSWTGRM